MVGDLYERNQSMNGTPEKKKEKSHNNNYLQDYGTQLGIDCFVNSIFFLKRQKKGGIIIKSSKKVLHNENNNKEAAAKRGRKR